MWPLCTPDSKRVALCQWATGNQAGCPLAFLFIAFLVIRTICHILDSNTLKTHHIKRTTSLLLSGTVTQSNPPNQWHMSLSTPMSGSWDTITIAFSPHSSWLSLGRTGSAVASSCRAWMAGTDHPWIPYPYNLELPQTTQVTRYNSLSLSSLCLCTYDIWSVKCESQSLT